MADVRFLVSARKYRPQTFADLVSQEHVTGTIQNAIRLERLAHAYLFSGPRGVGKTTAARLLAKAINCETPLEKREGAEPCRTCASCVAFEEGRSLSIIEIDAASNNSVEDVRALRENVLIPPQGARRKVYIVDEVHMLSNAAFNALLKTLEEPPAHALFIFATTEPHKVLPTILSRCQRFDFRRITVEETVERLREICQAEAIEADDASLHLVARKGDGALRDALSVFDQAVSLVGDALEYAALAEALGVVDRDLFFNVTEGARARDTAGLLKLVDGVVRRGYDLQEFAAGLAEHLRHLYAAASTGTGALIEADAEARDRYVAAAGAWAEVDLLRALMVADDAEREVKASPQPRLKLELALLKLAHLEGAADLRALVEKLERLEGMIQRGEVPTRPAGAAAAEPQPSPAPPPTATAEAPAAYEPAPEPAAPEPESQPDPLPPTPEQQPEPAAEADPAEPVEPRSDAELAPPEPSSVPEFVPPSQREVPPEAAPEPAAPSLPDLFPAPALKRRPRPDTPTNEAGGDGAAVAVAPAPAVDEHFGLPLGRVREAWPRLVERVRARRPSVATVLARAEPAAVQHGAIQVAVPDAFTLRLLKDEGAAFEAAMREVLGEDPPPLAFVVRTEEAETAVETDPFEAVKRLRHEHPVFRILFERFGAEIAYV